ncbi:hypothetical protein YT1_4881 [Rhodococcus ruber]|nr:hypothetical protein YT1_4881 [Rhodococcus ruber]
MAGHAMPALCAVRCSDTATDGRHRYTLVADRVRVCSAPPWHLLAVG